jgi:hypothetical protein
VGQRRVGVTTPLCLIMALSDDGPAQDGGVPVQPETASHSEAWSVAPADVNTLRVEAPESTGRRLHDHRVDGAGQDGCADPRWSSSGCRQSLARSSPSAADRMAGEGLQRQVWLTVA